MDGHIKVWWFEKIDHADPPDDDRVILVDPTYDYYTPGLKLMSIEKRNPSDTSDTFWYGQVSRRISLLIRIVEWTCNFCRMETVVFGC